MAVTLYRESQYFTTTLSVVGGINDSITTDIVLQSVTGIDDTSKPGIALFSYADPLDTATAEWITFTSINSTTKTLVGVTRGQEGYGAKGHANGVVVAFPHSKSHINEIAKALSGEESGATLTSPTINTPTIATPTINGTITFDTDAQTSITNLGASSMSRQAIMNGNFDVWQRGTSVAMTAANAYTADRWYCETATAGTDKTVSRQDGTGVNGSYYCARVAMVQDVDELLTFSQALESQDSIKFRGQKVTLSFYARGGAEFVADNATLVSKIVTGKGTDQKVLAFTTSADGVSQNNTLTTSWAKFTCTTTAAIAADITQIGVSFSFTHAGSGTTTNYFEVTQVQLCAGDVALPFQPKSFDEELRACQRYCEVLTSADAAYTTFGAGMSRSTTVSDIFVPFTVEMRRVSDITFSAGSTFSVKAANGTTTTCSSIAILANTVSKKGMWVQPVVASGLTAGQGNILFASNGTTTTITCEAEL